MELSKVKPSKIYDQNEVTFKSLLKQILKTKFNGFIRITTSSTNEGFILFKEGKGIAASYSRYFKNFVLDDEFFKEDALRKIEHNAQKSYIIEVYELTTSQIDYAIEFNEKYVLENDYLSRYLKKPKKKVKPEKANGDVLYKIYGDTDLIKKNVEDKHQVKKEVSSKTNILTDEINSKDELNVASILKEEHSSENFDSSLEILDSERTENFNDSNQYNELLTIEKPLKTTVDQSNNIKTLIKAIKGSQGKRKKENPPVKTSTTQKSMEELKLLLSSLNSNEIEMLELNIMNNIKKAILHIPKIKEKSVNISIDRENGLMGSVNIEAEYTNRGFLDLITKSSKDDIYYLEDTIYENAQMALINAFGNFNEVIDYFDISIKVI